MVLTALDEFLSALHYIVDIGESLVVLAGGELGVVSKIDALVTEDTAELVDLVDATNDQLLEGQLSGNTEGKGHVEVVVVGPEGLSGGTTSVLHEDGGLDFVEAVVVEVVADVPDDLGALDEGVSGALVHDQVKVTVPVSLLLVLEAVVLGGNLVQAWRKEDGLVGEDGELTGVGLALGVGLAGEALDTDDVASPDVVVLHGEWCLGLVVKVGSHDLALGAIDGHLVEAEVLASSTDVVDTASNADLLVLDLLALLKVAILLLEVAKVVGDGELVRVGRKGLLGLLEVLNSPAADLEVLLYCLLVARLFYSLANIAQCLLCTTHVRVQLGLVVGGVLLLGRGRGLLGGILLGLLNVLLPLLLPLLQLALADIFASDLVEQSLGLGLGGLGLAGVGAVLDIGSLELLGDLLDTVLDGIDDTLGRHDALVCGMLCGFVML
jgi:hypothetical protein